MSRTRTELQLIAELTLAVMSVTAVLALRRVFVDGSFLPSVITSVLAAHVVAALCRRRRIPPGATLTIGIAAAALAVTWLRLGHTTAYGLPTPDTWTVAREQLRQASEAFGRVTPPAPALAGFALFACAGAWVIAFAADAAAFRARAQLEAIIPATTVFVFGGALGVGAHRLDLAAVFVAAVLAHWLTQRAIAATASPTWLAPERGGRTPALLRVGAVLVGIGVLAAVIVGPRLPGAGAKSIVPWRASDRKAPSSRVTISPLVDIRTRLVDQADVVVFRVKATQRTYWRLTSLERFDGRIWSSNRQYRPANGNLGSDVDTSAAKTNLVQADFQIAGLSSIWLPAPFRPVRVSGTKARYDTDSDSILTDADTPSGLSYSVTSAVPTFDKSQLQAVPPVAPRTVADEYTELPADFPVRVEALAGQLTRGAQNQYDKAKALQDFFRSGAFTYDLNVQPGHNENDLVRFLFQTRRGYCEQFAGAYAAMARAVGLPSRVAVGFTPGEFDAATGTYVVKGFNGHAWPEVYLDGYGWVAFEPTPGRGMPGAESYTGVPEAQAQAGNPQSATTVPQAAPAPAPQAATTTTVAGSSGRPSASGSAPFHRSPWGTRLAVALALVVLLPLLWAAGVGAHREIRRRRRRSSATDPSDRVLVAWNEATEALARAGAPPNPWETPHEFAVRAAGATGLDDRLLVGLARVTTSAVYGAGPVAESAAGQAIDDAATIEASAVALLDRRSRLRRLVDPRRPD